MVIPKAMVRDVTVMTVVSAFGLFLLIGAQSIPTMAAVESSQIINARFLPRLVGGLLIVLSIVLLADAYRQSKDSDSVNHVSGDVEVKKSPWLIITRFVAGALAMVGYVLLFRLLGFLLVSNMLVFTYLYLMGSTRVGLNAAVSFISTVAVFALFEIGLRVPLPGGVLGIG